MTSASTAPRPWTCSDPTTFAGRTLAVRWPKILDDTCAAMRGADLFRDAGFLARAITRVEALRDEVLHAPLVGLTDDAPDREAWATACTPHVGKPWRDAPWYFAESFLYRRVLEASGWFADGPGRGVDPFLPAKLAEERDVERRLRDFWVTQPVPHGRVPEGYARRWWPGLLRASLWGNRADLSLDVGRAHGDHGGEDDLLIDDTAAVIERLGRAKRVAFLLDNAGTELAFDLQLAIHLEAEVALFAKSHPFFVSDATPADVTRLALPQQLRVVAHPFMTSSGFLLRSQMPADLVEMLRGFDLAIIKGDANYRRLVSDTPWAPETPLADVADFPIPFVALRTMKAEVVAGLPPGAAARAAARDPEWMTTGRFGLIQLVP